MGSYEEAIQKGVSFATGEGRELAHALAEKMIGDVTRDTNLYCIFHSFTLPKNVMDTIEVAFSKGAKFSVLIPNLPESRPGIEWLFSMGRTHRNEADIRDYSAPLEPGRKHGPGNLRMILNDKNKCCVIGMNDPQTGQYYGIYVNERTFYDFFEKSFLDELPHYRQIVS